MAAVILAEATGGDFSAEDILASNCPRLEINGRFLFNDDHIIATAERLLDEAQVVTPHQPPPPEPRRPRQLAKPAEPEPA